MLECTNQPDIFALRSLKGEAGHPQHRIYLPTHIPASKAGSAHQPPENVHEWEYGSIIVRYDGGEIVKGRYTMKSRAGWVVLSIFILTSLLSGSLPGQDAEVTVMNPRGIKPPIRQIPMAARPATLDGKTIYLVDTRFPRTRVFVEELFRILKEKYPNTKWVFKDKYGGYMDNDPDLWAEIKSKGDGMVLAVGH